MKTKKKSTKPAPKTARGAGAPASITRDLQTANQRFNRRYPGEPTSRQPVHTIYGGGHLYSPGMVGKFSKASLAALSEYAPNAAVLAKALTGSAGDSAIWTKVYQRVQEKLRTAPIEDFRIDFEDGYGTRSDEEEDTHARAAATAVASEMRSKDLPPFIGIRVKPFTEGTFARGYRTLDIFLKTLLVETNNVLPENFVVTLPKVTIPEQVRALVKAFEGIEKQRRLKPGTLKYEFMVETTQSVMNDKGVCPLRSFVDEGKGRCTGAHLGTYDYTASHNITAAYQTMAHPACDFAKQMMKVALTGTGILLSDGATNIMPVGPHKAGAGKTLTEVQRRENELTVHRAWKLSYDHIRYGLETGFYQGWDLHPAQLPVRYAAVYSFFLESLAPATERLKAFVEKAARATLMGDVFDDAATGQGLLNYFIRGLSCGALTEEEVLATGLTLEEIQGRSFAAILGKRTATMP